MNAEAALIKARAEHVDTELMLLSEQAKIAQIKADNERYLYCMIGAGGFAVLVAITLITVCS